MPVTASEKYSSPTKSIYRYPFSYEDETQGGRDYLMLRIMEVNYPTNNTSKIGIPYESEAADKKNHTEKTRIYLPIPQNLQDSNSLTWGEDRIGPLGAALYNFAEGRANTKLDFRQTPEFQMQGELWRERYQLSPTVSPGKRVSNPMPRDANPDPNGYLLATAKQRAEREVEGQMSIAQLLSATQGEIKEAESKQA